MNSDKLRRDIPISIYPPIMLYNKKDAKDLFTPLKDSTSKASIYIHIPFCPRKCDFCYFTSFSAGMGKVQAYISKLCEEIAYIGTKEVIKNKVIDSIYIGGGTPTYISKECFIQLFSSIREHFNLSKDIEISVEVRPGNEATVEKLQFLKSAGVNRISIGMQSFNDTVLRANGRNCSVNDGIELINKLNQLGFDNYNIDIMSGMLLETKDSWNHTINQLLKISPANVTVYKMQLYENSKLTQYCRENGINTMTEEQELTFTRHFYDVLLGNGYELMSSTYSFSKGSQYVSKYRQYRNTGEDLIALGIASNGILNGCVYQKTYEMDSYMDNNFEPTSAYRMSDDEIILRGIILGMKCGNIDRAKFEKKFKVEPYEHYAQFREMENLGFVNVTPDSIKVSYDLVFFIDDLIRTFFMPEKIKNMENLMLKYKNFDFGGVNNEHRMG
ncbi:MAG: coproporphyrinogen III oxidase family protein [Clostridia bacterium]|nr:coproporphyrinogen III oxidase family protein [Clostridia bacterium]